MGGPSLTTCPKNGDHLRSHVPPRLLFAEQRVRRFAILTVPAEMARHYMLETEDLALIRSKRRGMNRLGFAVQLPSALPRPGSRSRRPPRQRR